MHKIGKNYGNLDGKIYIDSNFKHLLTSYFTESLFLTCSNPYKIFQDTLGIQGGYQESNRHWRII